MNVQAWTFVIVGASFALYIAIALWTRAKSTASSRRCPPRPTRTDARRPSGSPTGPTGAPGAPAAALRGRAGTQ